MQAPSYVNHKKIFCITLQAICNEKYEFTITYINEAYPKSDCSI